MKVFIRKTILLLVLVLHPWATSFASEPDIRYRTIVYFNPDVIKIDVPQIEKAFKQFKLVTKLPTASAEPVVSYAVINDVKGMFPVPDASYLSYFGRGLDKHQSSRIQQSDLAVIIDIAYPAKDVFGSLKTATSSIFKYAEASGGMIWDSETRELFTPDAWKLERIDSWLESIPKIENHTVIHAYQAKKGTRAITLGMAKFGSPDIVVDGFSWSLNRAMGNLMNFVAQSLAEGQLPNNKRLLELNVDSLKNEVYKKEFMATLLNNAQPKVKLLLGVGVWEEGDPNNDIIALLFDNVKGDSLSEKHEAFLALLFGWEDQITYVKHNQLIEAASERAKNMLSTLKNDFNKGLNPGEFIQVKAPFLTPDGSREWMWVEILSWQGTRIKGLLKNEPYNIPSLKGGSEVVVNQEDVFDYIRKLPDGSSSGNETGALIEKYQN